MINLKLTVLCFIYFWLGYFIRIKIEKTNKKCRFRQYIKTKYGETCFCINKNCPNDFCPYEEKTDRKCGYYD